MKRVDNKIVKAVAAMALAGCVYAPFVVTAYADTLPAIGQAPVGQAPTEAAPPAAPAPMGAGDRPVSYSADQANRGKVTYQQVCVDCHGDDLRGGLFGGAPLRGNAFDEAFANGAPVSGLFSFISSAMPPDNPGSLSPTAYLELTAYILQQNGYQAGAALPSDPDALDHVLVQK